MPQLNQPTLVSELLATDIITFWKASVNGARTIEFDDLVASVNEIIDKNDSVSQVSSNTTLDDSYEFVVGNSGGTFTIELPDSTVNVGKTFKISNKGAGTITVQRTGSDVIATGSSSASSVEVDQWATYEFESDGAGVWFRS